MTKNNIYLPKENIAKVETVQELKKYEIKKSPLSKDARSKVIRKWGGNCVSENKDDYGPCKNSLCGCSCSSYTCDCANVSVRVEPTGTGVSASGRAKTEMNYLWAKGQANHCLFSDKSSDGETKFLSTTFGGEIEANPAIINNLKLKLGVNLVEHKSNGVEARLGVNVDSGGSINSDGVEAKFLGFGFSAGKKNGLSTPLGGFSVDKDDCVIQ